MCSVAFVLPMLVYHVWSSMMKHYEVPDKVDKRKWSTRLSADKTSKSRTGLNTSATSHQQYIDSSMANPNTPRGH